MRALLAVIKLTCRSAVRSYMFMFLLFLLAVVALAVPFTVKGDGTAGGYVSVSLNYSLNISSFILSLSALWLGCFATAHDIHNHQIHMIVSKPVPRVLLWTGKFLGILIIHTALLAISAALIYFAVKWQFEHRGFAEAEKKRVEAEVFTGRRVHMPAKPDIDQIARELYNRRLRDARKALAGSDTTLTSISRKRALHEAKKEVIARLGEIPYGKTNFWRYEGLSRNLESPLFIRYRGYRGQTKTKWQGETEGYWHLMFKAPPSEKADSSDSDTRPRIRTRPGPDRFITGFFYEIPLSPRAVMDDGTVTIGYTNMDPDKKSINFQLSDGPKLMEPATGFAANYARGAFVIFLKIIFLCALSCAAGTFFNLPTAVFVVASYILLGYFSSWITGFEEQYQTDRPVDFTPVEELHDRVGLAVNSALAYLISPMDKFSTSGKVAGGELVELQLLGSIILKFLLLRGLPPVLLGIWLYSRRELGTVIRQ